MPRVKPATITLRDGTILKESRDKIEYGPQLISTYAVELGDVPEYKKDWRGKDTTTVLKHVKQQTRVPIMSWPYSQVKSIDWGYISKESYDKVIQGLNEAKAKQAEVAKNKETDNGLGDNKNIEYRKSDI